MTPQQAIQILDEATANMSGNRQEHQQVMTALNTIRAIMRPTVTNNPPPEKPGEKEKAGTA